MLRIDLPAMAKKRTGLDRSGHAFDRLGGNQIVSGRIAINSKSEADKVCRCADPPAIRVHARNVHAVRLAVTLRRTVENLTLEPLLFRAAADRHTRRTAGLQQRLADMIDIVLAVTASITWPSRA